jgi:integrase
LTIQDFSVIVPSVSRHIPVPSVYSPEEVEKIIQTAKSSKSCGKRNHAIVLIAARLGLRSCDIASLCFENLCNEKKTIELIQAKTKEAILLPLLPEIIAAIDDYTASERPESDNRHIFLKVCQPIGEPLQGHTIYTIVSDTVEKSGIDVKGRRCGAHALRASLATALLNEGNSHAAIRAALGHKSPQALKSYVKTEVERLRDYALLFPSQAGVLQRIWG